MAVVGHLLSVVQTPVFCEPPRSPKRSTRFLKRGPSPYEEAPHSRKGPLPYKRAHCKESPVIEGGLHQAKRGALRPHARSESLWKVTQPLRASSAAQRATVTRRETTVRSRLPSNLPPGRRPHANHAAGKRVAGQISAGRQDVWTPRDPSSQCACAEAPGPPGSGGTSTSPGVHRAHAEPEGQAALGPAPEDKAAPLCRVSFSGRARQQVGCVCGMVALAPSAAIRRPGAR